MLSTQTQTRTLDGNTVTIEDVVAVAREQENTYLSNQAEKKMAASNELKETLISTKQPIYGVTTGFGDSCKRQISPEKTIELQRNMVHFQLNGVGPITNEETTRATMLVRANCLAKGNSGIRPVVVKQLIEYINRGILPLIPERGSLGASGDLVPLSYIASALIGEGDVLYKGKVRDVKEVLQEEGLEPVILEAKEGLALINGTSFMSGFATLAISDAEELAFVADLCTAMASEALLGNRAHFNKFIFEEKPHLGSLKSGGNISSFLSDSKLSRDYSQILSANDSIAENGYLELDVPIQDRYSIRCAPHITGVLYDTLEWAKKWVEIEINSSNDNPLFDIETSNVLNGGNFYGGHIAQAMDSLKVAVANIADLLDRQFELIVDEKFNNGLTPNLIQVVSKDDYEAGLNHGFKGMQLVISSITAEALKQSNPSSVFSRSTEAHNQDKVSMGTMAARDARTIVEIVQNVAAIHLLALCQAADLRGVDKLSSTTRKVYDLIRKDIPFVEKDRRMDTDIQHVVSLIRQRVFSKNI
ncbi:aromatic amino acid ammonia-lyase [Bacillus sp. ME78]|uniref:HAL/PAL/TAL family ammonia-lyase n=1 Tax=Bacillus sp. ME78 TaxID=2744261 RepID=UPI002174ED7C|nr:aromatic amino acid ammonia-lyase [Bacillus sp. ME78]